MDLPISISRLARELGIPPRKISDLFYARKLDDTRCPIIDGRRVIPVDYVPEIKRVLGENGVIDEAEAASCR